ncbi:glycine cleavage system aminomethyltransferase GcvT [Balneolaceae bacterium ANBcel3]|nr:glycine cleavage system aminomethyltransferase GcvT [Balneolaceae bacterium ANBcel3]
MLKRTPLFEIHRSYKAKMIDFFGFEMPVQYHSVREEHEAVRNHAGMFDVSHMGELLIEGDLALEVVQELTVNDASRLKPGMAQYTLLCRDNGGVIDDLLLYCLAHNEYMMVINASNIEKDLNWIKEVNRGRAEVSNLSEEIAIIALQGPLSAQILENITRDKVSAIPPFEFRSMQVSDYDNILVSNTGYTGEKGFELYCNIRHVNACDLWERIMEAGKDEGLMPCGLAVRDTLRIEAGLMLYGNDISEEITPLEAGLNWLLKWEASDFKGKEALLKQKKEGVKKKMCGFIIRAEKRIPRNGHTIHDQDGNPIGSVTSGTLSMSLDKPIGLGYLDSKMDMSPGTPVYIHMNEKIIPAEITRLPFYKSS